MPIPDLDSLDSFFATPAIWVPGMNEAEWGDEVSQMVRRSMAAHDFVSGLISPDDFADAIADSGMDPNICFELWEEGETLM